MNWKKRQKTSKSSKNVKKSSNLTSKNELEFEMSSDEAPAVSGNCRLFPGCFKIFFRKQQKQPGCDLFDADFGQFVKKSRIYNFSKGTKINKNFNKILNTVVCNWNNASRVRKLAGRMERSQSRARWHSQTRFSGIFEIKEENQKI